MFIYFFSDHEQLSQQGITGFSLQYSVVRFVLFNLKSSYLIFTNDFNNS